MPFLKDRVEGLSFHILFFFFSLLPRTLCLGVGQVLGLLAYALDSRHRQIALRNLRLALGKELSPSRQKSIARKSFMHFGRLLADVLKTPFLKEETLASLFRVQGGENLCLALSRGRGVLLLTGHIGNWEMGAFSAARFGRLHVIARKLDNDFLERRLLAIRRRLGARVIYKQEASRLVFQALKENGIVAILIDQNVLRSQAVFVDFFGIKAGTTPGLAAFHLRTGAPIVPAFCYPRRDGTFDSIILPPLEFPTTGQREEDVLKITRACTKIIEAQIRAHPDMWLWFHDRWKSRPMEESGPPEA